MDIKISIVEGGKTPNYETSGSAGADAFARLDKDTMIPPRGRMLVPLGIIASIPVGYEIQLRARSGNALKHGISLTNGIGTIDSDFRGEICAILQNNSDVGFAVCNGDRIAQMVVNKIEQANFLEGDLEDTVRADGGFGSTGAK